MSVHLAGDQPSNGLQKELGSGVTPVAKFTYHGHSSKEGNTFERPAVFVLTIRNGQIVESRDYLGPPRASR